MLKRVTALTAGAVSALCVAFVSFNEGSPYRAYRDQGGVWTICTGHTGPEVRANSVATPEQCNAYLRDDLAVANTTVSKVITVPQNECQRTALVDFTFNVGANAFSKSTLARKINANDPTGASAEFLKWTLVAGKPNKGVLNRRVREQTLYNVKSCPTQAPEIAALAASLGVSVGMYPAP